MHSDSNDLSYTRYLLHSLVSLSPVSPSSRTSHLCFYSSSHSSKPRKSNKDSKNQGKNKPERNRINNAGIPHCIHDQKPAPLPPPIALPSAHHILCIYFSFLRNGSLQSQRHWFGGTWVRTSWASEEEREKHAVIIGKPRAWFQWAFATLSHSFHRPARPPSRPLYLRLAYWYLGIWGRRLRARARALRAPPPSGS